MSKLLALMLAGASLVTSCAVLADDAAPTLQERVSYALSRARSAAQGDKQALVSLQTDAATDAAAEFGLGEYYVFIKDYPQSITWFRKSAEQGFAGGYHGLARAYEAGAGVAVNYEQAMRFYLKATELPEAEMHIGDLYYRGRGVQVDYAQAAGWYLKAAQGGSLRADIALGHLYETGVGVKEDDAQALQWYRKAADMGDATAQYLLGSLYEQPGTLQDYQQAAAWYQKASQQGVADAQFSLGVLYLSGKGVPVDAGKAVQQFQMAANQDHPQAQCRLATSFADGIGVPPDPFRAYVWFTLGAMGLDVDDPAYALADERMKRLEQQLSSTQVARAKQEALAWRDSHRAAAKKESGSVL